MLFPVGKHFSTKMAERKSLLPFSQPNKVVNFDKRYTAISLFTFLLPIKA